MSLKPEDDILANVNTRRCDDKAAREFKVKIIKRKYELQLNDTEDKDLDKMWWGTDFAKVVREVRDLEDKLASDKIPTKDIKYVWLTINPRDDDLDALVDTVDRILRKKWLIKAQYQFEQRGKTKDDVHGFHVHMLITKPKTKRISEIKREILSTCKGICGGKLGKTCNIKFKTKHQGEGYIAYLLGQKKEAKMDSVEVDKWWRSQYGLESPAGLHIYNALDESETS